MASLMEVIERFAPISLGLGIIVLLLGGHWLVHGSVAIARRAGISTLVVGLTVVAIGTSSPELFFNVIAATSGHTELSFGNVMGSNIANIGLILGISAVAAPLAVHGRVINKELPWLVLVSVAMVGLALIPLGAHGFHRFEGVVMLAIFILLLGIWVRMGRREPAEPVFEELSEETGAGPLPSIPAAVAFVVAGLALLLAGGKLSETGAVTLARWLGWSDALIGLTIVAFATSLPELATSIMAVRKGHTDLAVGNVVGSNFCNLLLVLGATATIADVPVPEWGWFDLTMMIVITLVLLLFAMTHRHCITRWGGVWLLVLYVGYMTFGVLRETL